MKRAGIAAGGCYADDNTAGMHTGRKRHPIALSRARNRALSEAQAGDRPRLLRCTVGKNRHLAMAEAVTVKDGKYG